MFSVGAGGHFLSDEKDSMLINKLRGKVDELEVQIISKDNLIKKLTVYFTHMPLHQKKSLPTPHNALHQFAIHKQTFVCIL